jgi:hypothetical protein
MLRQLVPITTVTFAESIGELMRKTMSAKQLAANRRNAQQSTGPKTPAGRAVSKMNALKHGLLSKEVLVRGKHARENEREFDALQARFREHLNPIGPLEEMLVDRIVTAHWRSRRALKAESGEIALNVDEGQWHRSQSDADLQWNIWENPVSKLEKSAIGNAVLMNWLYEVHSRVNQEGELTEAAIQGLLKEFGGKPNRMTKDLERLRSHLQQNPEGLKPSVLREQALTAIGQRLETLELCKANCEKREKMEEEARQAAATLPSPEVLEKILRYETKLDRQMYRAMILLERLQRRRLGEAVPPPTMELSERP